MSFLAFLTMWFLIGSFVVYVICWIDEDQVRVKELPILALVAALWPLAIILYLGDKLMNSDLSQKVVFDFRRNKSDEN